MFHSTFPSLLSIMCSYTYGLVEIGVSCRKPGISTRPTWAGEMGWSHSPECIHSQHWLLWERGWQARVMDFIFFWWPHIITQKSTGLQGTGWQCCSSQNLPTRVFTIGSLESRGPDINLLIIWCHNEVTQTRWLKWQKCVFSKFRRLAESKRQQGQSLLRPLSLLYRCCFLAVSLHMVFSVCVSESPLVIRTLVRLV